MEFSKHNIISKISNSDSYFIVNPLSGQADILEPKEAQKFIDNAITNTQEYIDKGYLVDPKEEDKLFKRKYLDFIDHRDSDEIQLFFTPWYTCNFNCSYCFQDEYTNPNDNVRDEVIDAFYNYVDKKFAARRKYITIFGGEPFLNSPKKKESIRKIIDGANRRNLDIAVVTNGYHIIDYIDILKTASVREIQVTLDGTQFVHDSRRMLKGGKGSFSNIVNGIDALLENNIPVNIRMIVDKDNVNNLPEISDFAIERGWTKSPLFKTALGRNYELHHCQTNNTRLFNRLEMYQEIYEIIKTHPKVLEFHKPAFSIAKFIFENGELPDPLFDSCSGTKTEWAFDYSGRIYSCTATVGNIGDELGKFYPKIELNEDLLEEWEERDVLSISECSNCSVRLACGGGCAVVAKTRTGKLHSPDCRPAKEFKQEVLNGGKVAVDFFSTECPPCEALAPKFENLSELYGEEIKFIKIFRQKNRELAENLDVNSSPTVIFYDNGKLVGEKLTGGIKRSEIIHNLNALISKEKAAEIKSKIKARISEYDTLILGGGPGGLTAGLYLCQARVNAVLVDIMLPGGQISSTHKISNYPGFIEPQPGFMLAHYMTEQTKICGTKYKVAVDVTKVDLINKTIVVDEYETIKAKKIVIATGASPKYLNVPGEKELKGRGISYCAICDAKYFLDKEVIVIGGGNTAVEEADYISKFASKVTIVHQFDKLQANKQAQEKAFGNPKINFVFDTEPRGFEMNGNRIKVAIENIKTGKKSTLEADGAFVFVGMKPNTGLFKDVLNTDDWGYIKTNEDMLTNIEGVYAVGDVRSKKYRQITTAVADGTIAAISVTKELDSF